MRMKNSKQFLKFQAIRLKKLSLEKLISEFKAFDYSKRGFRSVREYDEAVKSEIKRRRKLLAEI